MHKLQQNTGIRYEHKVKKLKLLEHIIPNLEGGKFIICWLVLFTSWPFIFPLIEICSWFFSLHRLPLLQTNLRDCGYVVYKANEAAQITLQP